MYIGRDFKREIELDHLKENERYLRPNRSWLDLFSLSLSYSFNDYSRIKHFGFTNLIDNLSEDEVIIIDSHGDIFKDYQIHYWRKERISDILPAIKCPSFKPETKIIKISETNEMRRFINSKDDIKSIVIESTDQNLYLNLVYGDTIKFTPRRKFFSSLYTKFFNKLKERYSLWGIDDCAWKPKKIRFWEIDFKSFQYTIERLERISNIIDVKLGTNISDLNCNLPFLKYNTMVFNHSTRWRGGEDTEFIFTGNTLAVVYDGNYYNFRLNQSTKESKDSFINGKI